MSVTSVLVLLTAGLIPLKLALEKLQVMSVLAFLTSLPSGSRVMGLHPPLLGCVGCSATGGSGPRPAPLSACKLSSPFLLSELQPLPLPPSAWWRLNLGPQDPCLESVLAPHDLVEKSTAFKMSFASQVHPGKRNPFAGKVFLC